MCLNFNARERSVFEITLVDLSSCDLLSIMCARSISYDESEEKDKDDDEDERDGKSEKVSVEAESLREKVQFGRSAWAEGPLDFVSVDECWIYFAPVFRNFVLRK